MPAGGAGTLQFTASATYSFLNNPLATVALGSLPDLGITASASATLEATVTHTADHTLLIGRLPNGLIHLSVSVKNTDDFETSLMVSSGVTAKIGSQDALAFLLNKINPNSAAEADTVARELPDAGQFKGISKQLSTRR